MSDAIANEVAFVPFSTPPLLNNDYENLNLHLQEMRDFTKVKFILFPTLESWGDRNHWYLIAYTVRDNTCHFFNSLPKGNDFSMELVQNFCQYIRQFMQPATSTSSESSYNIVTCTEQFNNNDCGLDVIMNAKAFLDVYLHWNPKVDQLRHYTPEQMEHMRYELLEKLNSDDQPANMVSTQPSNNIAIILYESIVLFLYLIQ